jgi:hypothetical protein
MVRDGVNDGRVCVYEIAWSYVLPPNGVVVVVVPVEVVCLVR